MSSSMYWVPLIGTANPNERNSTHTPIDDSQ